MLIRSFLVFLLFRGKKHHDMANIKDEFNKIHNFGIKHFGEEGNMETYGRAVQYLGGLLRTGLIFDGAASDWVKANAPLWSKSVGKLTTAPKVDLTPYVEVAVQSAKKSVKGGKKIKAVPSAPAPASSVRRSPSRSRSASVKPAPVKIVSSPVLGTLKKKLLPAYDSDNDELSASPAPPSGASARPSVSDAPVPSTSAAAALGPESGPSSSGVRPAMASDAPTPVVPAPASPAPALMDVDEEATAQVERTEVDQPESEEAGSDVEGEGLVETSASDRLSALLEKAQRARRRLKPGQELFVTDDGDVLPLKEGLDLSDDGWRRFVDVREDLKLEVVLEERAGQTDPDARGSEYEEELEDEDEDEF